MDKLVTRREVEPGRWLDSRRALWLASERALVVADLHWGYAAAHRAAGNLLPAWGDEHLAGRLDALVRDYQPEEMIWLGDVIHAAAGRPAAEAYLAARPGQPVHVLRGNHDRAWPQANAVTHLRRAGFVLHHGDRAVAVDPGEREMIGHHHPALAWSDGAGGHLRLPALITGSRRWILPAFSPWAAGAPWNNHLGPDETLWAIAPRRIFAVPPRQPRTPRPSA